MEISATESCTVESRNYVPPSRISPPAFFHEPIKTVATASKPAICVILCLPLSFFLSFAHQTARGSTEIARLRGNGRYAEMHSPLPTFSMHAPPAL